MYENKKKPFVTFCASPMSSHARIIDQCAALRALKSDRVRKIDRSSTFHSNAAIRRHAEVTYYYTSINILWLEFRCIYVVNFLGCLMIRCFPRHKRMISSTHYSNNELFSCNFLHLSRILTFKDIFKL